MLGAVAVITVNFEYVHRDVDRHGNVRLYFRRKKGGARSGCVPSQARLNFKRSTTPLEL
jgi:hypothetical protein